MRLFIAINLPESERERIHAVARPLRSVGLPVRWVEPAAYHVTLAFLGEVSDEQIPSIEAAMAQAASGMSGFPIELVTLRLMPTLRRPKVLWIEIAPSPELDQLQAALSRALRESGFALEERAFRPHLTLGRVRRSGRSDDFDGFPELAAKLEFEGTSFVESVDLMRSELSTGPAQYSVVSKTALVGSR